MINARIIIILGSPSRALLHSFISCSSRLAVRNCAPSVSSSSSSSSLSATAMVSGEERCFRCSPDTEAAFQKRKWENGLLLIQHSARDCYFNYNSSASSQLWSTSPCLVVKCLIKLGRKFDEFKQSIFSSTTPVHKERKNKNRTKTEKRLMMYAAERHSSQSVHFLSHMGDGSISAPPSRATRTIYVQFLTPPRMAVDIIAIGG